MAKTIHIDYVPTPKQALFHASRAKEILYGGAAGGGKSKAIVMDAFARCMQHPGTHAYIFRRTYRELEDTIITEALASIPKEIGTYNVGRHEMRLPGDSVIHFRHCASVANMYDYSGAEIHWLYLDELTTFEEQIYDFLKTRLRAKQSLGITPVVRCASNPGNIGHGWVKQKFVDAGPYGEIIWHEYEDSDGKKKKYSTQYIPALVTDNPHISLDYKRELEKKPEALRRALLNGDWDAFEGKVFMEFVNDKAHYEDGIKTHVINPFPIPPTWSRYVSFDHGYSRPFSVGWWAVAPNGKAYRYREWYGWNGRTRNKGIELSPTEIANGILDREEDERREGIYFDRIADPAIFERSRGDSIAQQMSAVGVTFRRGDHARIAGKMLLHDRLRFDSDGRPGLYVFSTCDQFIQTVPNLPYDQNKPEDVDTEAEDHVYDETRYFLMARYSPARVEVDTRPVEMFPYGRID